MAQQRVNRREPRSIFSLEESEELNELLAQGFPIYQNGREIDRYYPFQQASIDVTTLPQRTREALELFGAFGDLDWEETEADLERIDRESTSSPSRDDLDW